MADILAYVTIGLLAATLVVALFVLVSLRQVVRERVSHETIARAMRDECDQVRREAGDHARAGRGELAEHLNGFQTTLFKAFGLLGTQVGGQVREFGEKLDRGVGMIDTRVDGMAQKLNADIAKMGAEAGHGREALRSLIEAKLDAAAARQTDEGRNLRAEVQKGLEKGLGAASVSLATKLDDLGSQQIERLDGTRQALHLQTERNTASLEAMRTTVEGRLDALRQENTQKLDEMRQTVDEKLQSTLEARLGESFRSVLEQLARVYEGLGQMQTLSASVGDLKSVLTNVKTRGIFGEVQLERLLEDMLAPQQFVRNVQVRPNTQERVEFAVRVPNRVGQEECFVPIDAKFPRETYERLVLAGESGDAEQVKSCRKQLQADVKACAKSISQKYIAPPFTTEYAILFLPTEGLFSEVVREPGFIELIYREHRIVITGPTNFAAYLSMLQMGARTIEIERRSGDVWKVLGRVKKEFEDYNKVVAVLSGHLNKAVGSVDALGTRSKQISRALKSVEEMPEKTATELLFAGPIGEGDAAVDAAPTERSGPKLLFSDTAA